MCLLGGWEGQACFCPAFQAVEIRQKVGMKDRMGNTLKPQERVLAFVSAPQICVWGGWERGATHPSSEDLRALGGLLSLYSTFFPWSVQPQLISVFSQPFPPTPTPPFPLTNKPSSLRADSFCLLYQPGPQRPQAGDRARHGMQTHLPLASGIPFGPSEGPGPAWTLGTDKP